MLGLMQDRPLMISSLIGHAALFHRDREIVSWLPESGVQRTSYGELHLRALQAANALAGLAVAPGDRVATLAWNTSRHLALYFAIQGMGAVLHAVNPLLAAEQIEYVVNQSADKVLFFDVCFASLVRKLAPALKSVECFIAMTDRAHLPAIGLDGSMRRLLSYEDLLDAQQANYVWPSFDENTAAAIYHTSGTTGKPKGVVYSHRSTVLSALAQLGQDAFGIHSADTVLLTAPVCHAGAWGIPCSAAMAGAQLVLAPPFPDPVELYDLMRDERVSVAQGTPAVWSALFAYLDENPHVDVGELALNRVLSGGSAASAAAIVRFERDLGVQFRQIWGMTESSAIGTTQDRVPWGVELQVVGEDEVLLPWDGQCVGHLHIRGPWIAGGYYPGMAGSALDAEGWLPTGDMAAIDAHGCVRIVDRTRDMIKSGGELIPSLEIENVAGTHPAVAEAALIGVAHPKWQERPLLVVVRRPGAHVTKADLIGYLTGKVPKWWLPDDVVFVHQLPRTATGLLRKNLLREQYRSLLLP
jgi:fatty-acyl-CoA synthase